MRFELPKPLKLHFALETNLLPTVHFDISRLYAVERSCGILRVGEWSSQEFAPNTPWNLTPKPSRETPSEILESLRIFWKKVFEYSPADKPAI